MIKVEAKTLEEAFEKASSQLDCSITMLQVEVVQNPSNGVLGLFGKKNAIIVAMKKPEVQAKEKVAKSKVVVEKRVEQEPVQKEERKPEAKVTQEKRKPVKEAAKPKAREKKKIPKEDTFTSRQHDIITPSSMVTAQEDDYEEAYDENEYVSSKSVQSEPKSKEEIKRHIADLEAQSESIKRVDTKAFNGNDVVDRFFESTLSHDEIVEEVKTQINALFKSSCFEIDAISVEMHDEKTLLVEFSGADSALLIGKEGYRYKALSYMLFNWINAKYGLQLRLEIAEFLQNQEEMIKKYLVGIAERVNNDGRAQTKVLDGVLVQIALKELREMFPDKYVAIRTNRDGLKYIIINSFRNND